MGTHRQDGSTKSGSKIIKIIPVFATSTGIFYFIFQITITAMQVIITNAAMI